MKRKKTKKDLRRKRKELFRKYVKALGGWKQVRKRTGLKYKQLSHMYRGKYDIPLTVMRDMRRVLYGPYVVIYSFCLIGAVGIVLLFGLLR